MQNFCASKGTAKKVKDNSGRRTFLQTTYLMKDSYLEYKKSSHNSIIIRQITRKWIKDLNWHFSKGSIQMVNMHNEKMLISYKGNANRNHRRQHFTLGRAGWPESKRRSQCREDAEKRALTRSCWWCTMVQPLWKTAWKFLEQLNTELS